MTGLDGLNPSPGALVVALVQFQVPRIAAPGDLGATAEKIARMVRGAKAGMPSLDLVVFPEYSLNGLDPKSWTDQALLCDLDGPEVSCCAPRARRPACGAASR